MSFFFAMKNPSNSQPDHCRSYYIQQIQSLQHSEHSSPQQQHQQHPTMRSNNHLNTSNQWCSSTTNTFDGVCCPLCIQPGHVASICLSKSHNHLKVKANCVSGLHTSTNPQIIDSRGFHHITVDPHNLQAYNGIEQVSMGDGNKILVTHINFFMNHTRPNVDTYTNVAQLVIGSKRSNKSRRPLQRMIWVSCRLTTSYKDDR